MSVSACPSADKEEMVCAHSGIFSLKVRKEILTHATTQMNLENITLREISQSQKTDTV